MEKTNKYYGVIENLVKQNRKYSGLEAILDDIIDDVYSHSEVIINSISNDSVIQSYLEKVVATSIITVPKKMGFHSEVKHRTITATQVLDNIAHKQEEKVNNALVDKMINTISVEKEPTINLETTEPVETVQEPQVALEELPVENLQLEEPVVEEVKEPEIVDNAETLELNLEEPQIEQALEEENRFEELLAPTEELVEEKETVFEEPSLVENTLEMEDLGSDLSAQEIVEDNNLENDTEETISLEMSEPDIQPEEMPEITMTAEGTIEEAPLELSETVETVDTVDAVETPEIEDLSLDNTSETLNADFDAELEPVAELKTDDSLEEITLDDNFDEVSGLLPAQGDIEPLSEDLSFESDDMLSLDLQEEGSENSNPLDVINEDSLDQIADVITTTLQAPSESSLISADDFKPTDYSIFSFSTDKYKDDIDAEEIVNEIKDVASKRPELNIIDVYNLKFKDKLTIPQVASKLDMSEDNVIEALNELISIAQ
mgnify:CR=1 FL=1